MLDVGVKAPDFTLPDGDGTKISLDNFRGKKIVLWFFPKANTPGWITEGQGFRDEYQKFEEKNVAILGCSADPPKKQKKFCEKQKFTYPLLSDENHEMLKDYGVWGKKKFMGREFMGLIRSTFLIKDNKIIKEWRSVRVKDHAKEVLNFIQNH